MTIQSPIKINALYDHINHVCYVANENSGHYSYYQTKTRYGTYVTNKSLSRTLYPSHLQQATFYIRKLQLKIVHARHTKSVIDWVLAVELPFVDQIEETNSLGYCYMPLFPVLSFDYYNLNKSTYNKTIQLSTLKTFFIDIVAGYFDAHTLIFMLKNDVSGGHDRYELLLSEMK